MRRIKVKDQVIVVAGKCKGQTGVVNKIMSDKLLIDGINLSKKHQKGNPNKGIEGGIIEKEMPIHISNVAIYNTKTSKKDKVGFRLEDGKKVRFFKSNNEIIDI